MTDSDTDGLITIGALARASGLTASALRFYDDCGLLVPASVDEVTGYRYYAEAQCARATLIRRLRAIDMPLEAVSAILSGDTGQAGRLLDEHVDDLSRRAREAAAVAEAIKKEFGRAGQLTLSTATLAEAIDQVRHAAALDREIPVLAGVLVEANATALTLTATDRYRLSTRTLVPHDHAGPDWSVVVDAGELTHLTEWLRDLDEVALAAAERELVLTGAGGARRCGTLDESFPDYRAVLTGVPRVRTRVVVDRRRLLDAIGETAVALSLSIDSAGLTVTAPDGHAHSSIPARVTGASVEICFDPALLHAAIDTAVGPEIMVDIAAPDQPVVVRSATDGSLTTLAMPMRNPHATNRNGADHDHDANR
ncbi:MerR family transcriptional regulator [Nocardia sp. NPDC052566]|uniref:DNA polymerase III subunit beta family protein n=1 Tax=Nocardia sp. NPDC052566 TaxID=3364330 RepID=UPI0037C7F2AE